ncbi:MAG: hypothetical protein HQ592_17935 [Planctomycetes bacterium]|nr:hypothetical protein [Planctomycetota bacterium]
MAARALAEEMLDRAVALQKEGWDYFEQASERTGNELAKRTFQRLAVRCDRQADHLEEIRRLVVSAQTPPTAPPVAPRSMFDEIMRTIQRSAAPTAADIAGLREAIVYAIKLRDVYAHFADVSDSAWESSLYEMLNREGETTKLTLADMLDYLRSNFELTDLIRGE